MRGRIKVGIILFGRDTEHWFSVYLWGRWRNTKNVFEDLSYLGRCIRWGLLHSSDVLWIIVRG